MINGLINTFEELNGLKTIYVDELETGLITQDEINTLNNIDTSKTIQSQLNDLQTAVGGINITISGNTISGVVLLPYLEQYYYTKDDIISINANAYNSMIDTLDNYVTQSTISSYVYTLSGGIHSISGRLDTANANITLLEGGLFLVGVSLSTANTNITTISGHVSTISGHVSTISGNVNTANTNITTISSNVNTISGNVSTISTNLNTANNNITTISGNVSTISGNVFNISGNLSTLSGNVNTISTNLNTANDNITTISGNVFTISGNVSTISSNINNANTNITTISGNINTANTNITTISGNINTANTNITTISGNVFTISGNVSTISGNVNTISGNVNTANNNITTISGQIDSISGLIYNTISSNIYTNTLNIVSISSLLYNTISSNIYDISSISGLIHDTISSRIKDARDRADAAQTSANNAQSKANTAADDAEYSRKQIDTQGTKVFNLFGIEIWDPEPSGLNQRIMDAKKAGTDAQSTANNAASSASSNASAITAIAIVLGFNSVGLLITAVASGGAYTTLAATVAGLSATVATNSSAITDLNRVTRYMSTSLTLLEGDYTKFISAIKICRSVNDINANVFLSHKDDVNSYFNNIVQFNQNIEVNGTIINTDISSIKNKVTYMNVDTVNLINTTTFLSHINICDPEDPDFIPAIHLSSTTGYSYFVNDVNFYNDVTIGGLINNTALNNKIQYITCISGNTLVNSSIYVKDFNDPTKYVCKLANSFDQLSYIRSDLTISGNLMINGAVTNDEINYATYNINTISGKIQYITSNFDIGSNSSNTVVTSSQLVVDGKIKNPELNTNSSNLTTISGLVNTNKLDITTISGLVNTNKLNITTLSGLVNTNKLDITTISGYVNTLSGQISNNNLGTGITVTGDALNGYTITIGNALSSVYINGNLYYNNDLLFKKATSEGNQVGIQEFINQL
jgi:methyl-accepting chemotaxis protein